MECGLDEKKGCCSLRGRTAGEYGVGDHVDQQKRFLANNEKGRDLIWRREAYSKFSRLNSQCEVVVYGS